MPRRLALPLTLALMPVLVPVTASTAAAQGRPPSSAELLAGIDELAVVGRALYVAAHPDDENTRLLAWLANEKKVRAAYLSLTRGDGGQNLIGAEQGPLLGLIRTQELLAARRGDGAEQLFTRARDFGYSKSPEETLRTWDRDAVLADVVRAIRGFQPDVIITRFPTKGLETHGHHTASAILAEEAFGKAADPAFHPELGAPWKARRIAWNKSSFFIKPGEDLSAFFKLDIGAFNAALGESYGEMAARSRSMHKSQGFGAAPTRGESLEYFQALGSEAETIRADLFEGVDLTWRRVKGGEKVIPLVKRARDAFRADRPWEVIPSLLAVRAAIAALPECPWKREKLDATDELILGASGLFLDATAEGFEVTPGASINVTATLLPRTPAALRVTEVRFAGGAAVPVPAPSPTVNGKPVELKQAVTIPADAAPSTPYWLVEPPGPGLYPAADPALIGHPESPPRLTVEFTVAAAGAAGRGGGSATLHVTRPVLFRWVDPVDGERARAVEIAPLVTVRPESASMVFPDARPRTLRLRASWHGASVPAPASLRVVVGEGWRVSPEAIDLAPGDARTAEAAFTITPPAAATAARGSLRVVTTVAGVAQPRTLDALHIDHRHIPIQALFPEVEVKLTRFDLQHARTRIGYIPGAGDDVPQALRQVGYEVTLLPGETLATVDLDRFEAIVVGVRAFNTVRELDAAHGRLMDWVSRGGTLVAQYSTANRISKVPPLLGPYPFDLSQERVTDETAAVDFAAPAHAVLTTPNRIGPADFEGWVQERGLYFAGKWDDRYQAPLSMRDPGEPPRKGSLLVAAHGKGSFVYTGLAFFRQLPAGVPGAFRLFANLVDHGVHGVAPAAPRK